MTQRILCIAVAMASLGIGSAAAQTQPIDVPATAYGPTWTGPYLGAAFGVQAMVDRANLIGAGPALSVDGLGGQGVFGSIYGGFDYQFMPQALVGVLAELSYGGLDSTVSAQVPGAGATLTTHPDLGWALLLRAGVLPTPSTLLYGIGGYTGQNIHTTASAFGGGGSAFFDSRDTFNGWTVGAGIETKLGAGWSTKVEYRYSQYGQKTLPGTALSLWPSIHTARIGLSYRFGAPGGATSEAAQAASERKVNWTGIYLGGAGGAGALSNNVNASFGGASASANTGGQGLLGSVFAGADYQFTDRALVGVMGDLTWPGLQSTTSSVTGNAFASVNSRQNMTWSVLGRIGFLPTPSTLIYAAAGYTGATFTTTASAAAGGAFASVSQDSTLGGWTIGPGVEIRIADGWSTRIEYRYTQFGQASAYGATFQPSNQTVRAGLSYKFGGGY